MINDEGKAFRASSNRCYLHEKIDSIYSLSLRRHFIDLHRDDKVLRSIYEYVRYS